MFLKHYQSPGGARQGSRWPRRRPKLGLALPASPAQLMCALRDHLSMLRCRPIQRALGFSCPGLDWGQRLRAGLRRTDVLRAVARRPLAAEDVYIAGLLVCSAAPVGGSPTSQAVLAARAVQDAGAAIVARPRWSLIIHHLPGRPSRATLRWGVYAAISVARRACRLIAEASHHLPVMAVVMFVNVPDGRVAALAAPRCFSESRRQRGCRPPAAARNHRARHAGDGLTSAATSPNGVSHWRSKVVASLAALGRAAHPFA